MPAKRGMLGPGARGMGGMGKKPAMPATPFGGGAGGTLAGAAPKRPSIGMGGGPPMGGPRAAPGAIPSASAGVGAFKKGGHAEKEEVKKHARGGAVEHDDEKEDKKLFGKMMKEHDKEDVAKHAKGGPVLDRYVSRSSAHEHKKEEGIHRGADSQRSAALKGAGVASTSTKMADSKPRVSRQGSFK